MNIERENENFKAYLQGMTTLELKESIELLMLNYNSLTALGKAELAVRLQAIRAELAVRGAR